MGDTIAHGAGAQHSHGANRIRIQWQLRSKKEGTKESRKAQKNQADLQLSRKFLALHGQRDGIAPTEAEGRNSAMHAAALHLV